MAENLNNNDIKPSDKISKNRRDSSFHLSHFDLLFASKDENAFRAFVDDSVDKAKLLIKRIIHDIHDIEWLEHPISEFCTNLVDFIKQTKDEFMKRNEDTSLKSSVQPNNSDANAPEVAGSKYIKDSSGRTICVSANGLKTIVKGLDPYDPNYDPEIDDPFPIKGVH